MNKKSIILYIQKLTKNNQNKFGTATKIKCLGGGSYGLASLVDFSSGEKLVYKAVMLDGMLKRETAALELLGQHSTLKVPKVLEVYTKGDETPYDIFVMEYIEGVNALSGLGSLLKSKKKRQEFRAVIVKALSSIHKATQKEFGFVGEDERFNSWREFYNPMVYHTFNRATELFKQKKLSKKIYNLLKIGVENIDFILSCEVKEATLLHGDLHVLNILVDKKSFIPTGIIDPFNSMWGDREYDLFQLQNFFDKYYGLYDAYKKLNNSLLTKKVDLKCAFYALVNEVLCHTKTGKAIKFLYWCIAKRVKKQYKKHLLIP